MRHSKRGVRQTYRYPGARSRRGPGFWSPSEPAVFKSNPHPSRVFPIRVVPAGLPGFRSSGVQLCVLLEFLLCVLLEFRHTDTWPCDNSFRASVIASQTVFFFFFLIPFIIFAHLLSLLPTRNSDPGSQSRHFPLPSRYGTCFHFYREKIQPFLPSSTRIVWCLPTLQGGFPSRHRRPHGHSGLYTAERAGGRRR